MASRKLDDLTPRMRPLAEAFLARLTEAGVLVLIVQTLRTTEESAANMATGVSWVKEPLNSKHVDARLRGFTFAGSDAMDVAPYDTYALHGPDKLQWNASDPVWLKIRDCAQASGLKWGVVINGKQVDPGHVEFPGPARLLPPAPPTPLSPPSTPNTFA